MQENKSGCFFLVYTPLKYTQINNNYYWSEEIQAIYLLELLSN